MKLRLKELLTSLAIGAAAATAAMAQQGVTDDEIVIGTNTDLSGPFAPFAVQAVRAMQMRLDAVNEAGGIHGRKIRYVVEDHGYQVPKAMANFNKLINADKVFATVINLGTHTIVPGFRMMEAAQVANLTPATMSRQMTEGDTSFKYASFAHYDAQVAAGMTHLREQENVGDNVCGMYIPNDYGIETVEGAKAAAQELGMRYVAETAHKPDESEFIGALSKLRDAECDVVATALGIRQLIIALGTAKKMGWSDAYFLATTPSYHEAIAAQVGVTDGLYVVSGLTDYRLRMDDAQVQAWHAAYKTRFDEEPGTGAVLGNMGAENLLRGLEAAGRDLTPDSFRTALETLDYRDPIAGVQLSFSPDNHVGGRQMVISRVEGGIFKELARK